jgi:hypothetical protein
MSGDSLPLLGPGWQGKGKNLGFGTLHFGTLHFEHHLAASQFVMY